MNALCDRRQVRPAVVQSVCFFCSFRPWAVLDDVDCLAVIYTMRARLPSERLSMVSSHVALTVQVLHIMIGISSPFSGAFGPVRG